MSQARPFEGLDAGKASELWRGGMDGWWCGGGAAPVTGFVVI